MRAFTHPPHRWTLARVCDAVDLVVDLQQLAVSDRLRYEVAVIHRARQVRIWLYELIVAATALGFREVAPTLIDALPGVDMGSYSDLLSEIGALPQRPVSAAVGGQR